MQLPAGTLEPGEDVYAGARREAFEETGLDDLRFRSEVVAASRPGTAVINRATSVGGRPIGAGYLVSVLEHDVTQARIEVDGATAVVDLEGCPSTLSVTWSTSPWRAAQYSGSPRVPNALTGCTAANPLDSYWRTVTRAPQAAA